jgi:hypothetical protein
MTEWRHVVFCAILVLSGRSAGGRPSCFYEGAEHSAAFGITAEFFTDPSPNSEKKEKKMFFTERTQMKTASDVEKTE